MQHVKLEPPANAKPSDATLDVCAVKQPGLAVL